MSFPIYMYELRWDEAEGRLRGATGKPNLGSASKKTSFWKRERSVGRRTSQATPAGIGAVEARLTDEQSADEAAAPGQAEHDEVAAKQPSIWKRELSFRRGKPESVEPVEEPRAADVLPASFWFEPESVLPESEHENTFADEEPFAAAATYEHEDVAEQQPSIWKRELSFRSGNADGVQPVDSTSEPESVMPESVVPESEHAVADEPSFEPAARSEFSELSEHEAHDDGIAPQPSIWKRELSFARRKPKAERDWEFDVVDSTEPEQLESEQLESEQLETEQLESEQLESLPVESLPVELPRVEEPLLVRTAESFGQTVDVEPAPALDPALPLEVEPGVSSVRDKRKRRSIRARQRPSKSGAGGKKLVGLKIGASQIAAAYVHSNGSREVLKLARTPLERGVVVAGELRDPDALAAALKTFFNENKLPKRNIRLGIASNRVGVRVLDVAGVEDPALLGNAVRFRAQEVLPIPLSEAVLDYRVLRERTDEEGNLTSEVLVAFAYRELVDRYMNVCRAAGLQLVGIDLDGFALLRALVDPAAQDGHLGGAAVVTVALGHDRSIMSVSDGEVCEFTRVIEWGGSSLDTAVARILALTPSQAEPIKRELTLDRDAAAPDGLSADQAGRARSAMVQEVHAFAREFVSSLQFYQAQPRSLDIREIMITGGMAHMPGLAERLQELIGVTVRIGDPPKRVKAGKHVNTESIGSFALAIGLGIED